MMSLNFRQMLTKLYTDYYNYNVRKRELFQSFKFTSFNEIQIGVSGYTLI